MLQLTAIVPRSTTLLDPAKIRAGASRTLTAFATDLVNRMAKYPPQTNEQRQRAASRRQMYRRTGDLGRHWMMRPGEGRITVFNNVHARGRGRPYAVYVQGPVPGGGAGFRQAAIMGAKGWQNISTVSRELWIKHKRALQTALVVG